MTIHFHSPCVAFSCLFDMKLVGPQRRFGHWRLEEALIAPEIDPSLITVLTAVLPAM